jgi:large subunit ribosomal protein L9
MHTRVILNKDLASLGEEGDVKDVAKGFARNFLFPRGIALPYTPRTIAIFEKRKSEIDARKEQKRRDAAGIKERLETVDLTITMPAGANGKLYGAVTSHTIADELVKAGFDIERKRIEVPGNTVKNVGKYKALVKLYGAEQAEVNFTVLAQIVEEEKKPVETKRERRPRFNRNAEAPEALDTTEMSRGAETAPAPETPDTATTEAVPETPVTE